MGNEPSRAEIAEEKRREREWEEQMYDKRRREDQWRYEQEHQKNLMKQQREQYERDQQRGQLILLNEFLTKIK